MTTTTTTTTNNHVEETRSLRAIIRTCRANIPSDHSTPTTTRELPTVVVVGLMTSLIERIIIIIIIGGGGGSFFSLRPLVPRWKFVHFTMLQVCSPIADNHHRLPTQWVRVAECDDVFLIVFSMTMRPEACTSRMPICVKVTVERHE